MAGFFGLFNYEKEGPGVEKNAPKKKRFIEFFEIYFKNFWKLCINSIWYWLLTILGITSGFAAAGMTNLTRNMAVDTHSFGTSDFFSTIKKNWKQSLAAGIINTLVLAFLVYDIYFFYIQYIGTGAIMHIIGLAICITALLIFFVVRYYLWFIITTFKLKLKQIYKNSLKLALVGIKNNLFIFGGIILLYGICYLIGFIGMPITNFIFILLLIFVVPPVRFLIIQFNVFDVIKKYMIDPYYAEHPDEDIELRRRLGVYDGDKKYSEEDLL